ncbi:hypothetical protein ACFQ6N_35155 [Kitasatospora sp. NPDC056446]|uniref:hypothetical protein n=1 Tax=Kitasatospora sp. NPDC056446 TaxID=3345819 RepID=UPI00367C757B
MAGKKKQKRPLAEGVVRPPKRVRRRPAPELSPRTVRRTAWLTGLLTPVLMVALAALGSNPDYQLPCGILAFLVLVAGVLGMGFVRARGWVIAPAVLFGVLLLAIPTPGIRAEIISQRAVKTEVVVTAAHSSKDKNGRVGWTCDIRRADGQPLPHGRVGGFGCADSTPGSTMNVLADPAGWAPPATPDDDISFRRGGVWVTAVLAVLWGLLTLAAARRTLREPTAPTGRKRGG